MGNTPREPEVGPKSYPTGLYSRHLPKDKACFALKVRIVARRKPMWSNAEVPFLHTNREPSPKILELREPILNNDKAVVEWVLIFRVSCLDNDKPLAVRVDIIVTTK